MNVDFTTVKNIEEALLQVRAGNPPDRQLFLDAQKKIHSLMRDDSYPRFLQSNTYRNLVFLVEGSEKDARMDNTSTEQNVREKNKKKRRSIMELLTSCLLYTSPSPRDS